MPYALNTFVTACPSIASLVARVPGRWSEASLAQPVGEGGVWCVSGLGVGVEGESFFF